MDNKIKFISANQLIYTIGNFLLSFNLIYIFGLDIFGKIAIFFLLYFFIESVSNQGYLTNFIKKLINNEYNLKVINSINIIYSCIISIIFSLFLYIYYFIFFQEYSFLLYCNFFFIIFFNLKINFITIIYLNLNKNSNFILIMNFLRFLLLLVLINVSFYFTVNKSYLLFFYLYSISLIIISIIINLKLKIKFSFKNIFKIFNENIYFLKKTLVTEFLTRIQNLIILILFGYYGSEIWLALLRLTSQFTRIINFPNLVFEKYAMSYFNKNLGIKRKKYSNLKLLFMFNIVIFILIIIAILILYYLEINIIFEDYLLIFFVIPYVFLKLINIFDKYFLYYKYYSEEFTSYKYLTTINLLNVIISIILFNFYGPIVTPYILIFFALLRLYVNIDFKIVK